MNMMKKNGGFTLVELIVVIAILAILAGVAVPAYSGYLTKAKDAAALTELDAVKTACFAVNAEVGPVGEIEVAAAGTVSIDGETATLTPYYTGDIAAALADTSYAGGATWSSTTSKWAPVGE